VLIVSFGGPNGPGDVRPFLERVLQGRRVTPERIDDVAHHYELFGGVSPITELTRRQAEGLQQRLPVAHADMDRQRMARRREPSPQAVRLLPGELGDR